jgi:transcriptional regulator with GAF, ATPase, and Fis domain
VGRFQLADGGSLFLDEVGEIPLALQAKLLRVLQEGSFERMGEEATRKVSVRVIAATNRDLRQEVEAGRFRRDLYYRLSVFPLELPPLRDRRDDIPALAEHFIKLSCGRLSRPEIKLTVRDVERLQDYDWPGNVRELQNMIERAAILSKGDRLRLDLALVTTATRRTASLPGAANGERPRIMKCKDLEQMQRDNIIAALEYTRGKIYGPKGAAEILASTRQPSQHE